MRKIIGLMFILCSGNLFAQFTGRVANISFDIKDKPVNIYEMDEGSSRVKKETYVSTVNGSLVFQELNYEANALQSIFRYTAPLAGIDVSKCSITANTDGKRLPKEFYFLYISMKTGSKMVMETFYVGADPISPTSVFDSYISFTDKALAEKYLASFGK